MISIIIPVYNGEEYIENLINNFNSQVIRDYNDLELIFVDDGSTDKTLEILNKYKENKMFKISIFSQENGGVSSARNLGIKNAKGDYITFVDVDDAVTKDYVETLQNHINSKKFDVFVFASMRIKEGEISLNSKQDKVNCNYICQKDMLIKMLKNPTKFGVYNLLLKKDFVNSSGLNFALGYKYYEDYDFIYRTFALAENIIITEKPLYFYILRENSAMQKFTKDRIDCIELLEELALWFKTTVPDFYNAFNNWGVPRIYWSVLWQSVLALDNYQDFKTFSKKINAKIRLKTLMTFPDKKVKYSTKVFMNCPWAYYFGVKFLGKANSKVEKVDINAVI